MENNNPFSKCPSMQRYSRRATSSYWIWAPWRYVFNSIQNFVVSTMLFFGWCKVDKPHISHRVNCRHYRRTCSLAHHTSINDCVPGKRTGTITCSATHRVRVTNPNSNENTKDMTELTAGQHHRGVCFARCSCVLSILRTIPTSVVGQLLSSLSDVGRFRSW